MSMPLPLDGPLVFFGARAAGMNLTAATLHRRNQAGDGLVSRGTLECGQGMPAHVGRAENGGRSRGRRTVRHSAHHDLLSLTSMRFEATAAVAHTGSHEGSVAFSFDQESRSGGGWPQPSLGFNGR